MADKHGVVRLDNVMATHDGTLLASVRYMGAKSDPKMTAIDNGCVVEIAGYEQIGTKAAEREVRVAYTPSADTTIDKLGIIASPEVMYDERKHNLYEFYNEAGVAARVVRPHKHDTIGFTAVVLDAAAAIAVGDKVEIQASEKLKVVKSSSKAIGEIVAIEVAGQYTYHVVEFN